MRILDLYNKNIYIETCAQLSYNLNEINLFIKEIRESSDLSRLNDLRLIFQNIFTDNNYIEIKLERLLNPHYSQFRKHQINNGNSSAQIFLSIKDDDLKNIDLIYDKALTYLLRYYKKLYTILNLPSYEIDENTLIKYEESIRSQQAYLNDFIENSLIKDNLETREKLKGDVIKNLPHNGFYHLTNFENLENIISNGMFSYNLVREKGLLKSDMSNPDIQAKRKNVHNYVPLYINPKNPFLNSFKIQNNINNLVLLEVFPHILVQKKNTRFSDGNAADVETNLFENKNDLEKINWKLLQSGIWENNIESKRIMCSEILIPNHIEDYYIQRIIIKNENQISKVMSLFPNRKGISITLDSNFFTPDNC